MFDACADAVGRIEMRTLIAAHIGGSHRRTEKRIFARPLRHTPPTGIARNIDHRRKGPSNTNRRCFQSRHMRCLLNQSRIPCRSHPQRDRELCPKSVNNVESEKQWNVHTRFLDRDSLVFIDEGSISHIQQRPDLPLRNHVLVIASPGARARRLPSRVLDQLTNFFFQGHAAENSLNPRVKLRIRDPGCTRNRR